MCGDPECERCFPGAREAREEYDARLEAELEAVMALIHDGDLDDDMSQSPFIDSAAVMRLARLSADDALWLQIDDYAQDLAERRLS
jgi:hypothetical protein